MVLLDTHVISWMAAAPSRLSAAAQEAIETNRRLCVSPIIAFEFDDLVRRGRLPNTPLDSLIDIYELTIIDFPTDCWRGAVRLPDIHRDPVDRLLISHAMQIDLPIISGDDKFPHYPVRTIW